MELLNTQKLKGKIEKIRRPLQMIVLLELRNDFNDNSDNNDKNDSNDDDESDKVNSDSLSQRDNFDDLLNKTDLSEKRKFKRVVAINADIIRKLNDENFKLFFDIMNQKGESQRNTYVLKSKLQLN